jgi:cytochrome c oxidase subunit 3
MTGPARRTLDVSGLPPIAFGRRDPVWLGVVLLMTIETTVFGLAAFSYFYVRDQLDVWPPTTPDRRQLLMGVGVIATLLASLVPTHLVNRATRRADLARVRAWLIGATALGLVAIVFRILEFHSMRFRWDSNVYGSVFWGVLVLHTVHLLTGVGENLLFLTLLVKGPVEQKHLVDLEVNGLYWYFVVGVWLPMFAILYLEWEVFR